MAAKWSATPSRPLRINGVGLEYACWGPSPVEAPTMVLLHEGLGCVALWRDFPQRLAKVTGMGVFAYSRQGYGKSDAANLPRPLDFMTREAMDVLPGVLDTIGFQRGILFGHSDGASIAAIHAGSVADKRVRGLILMAPHFFTEKVGLNAIAEAKRAYDSGELKARLGRYHCDPDNAFRGWNDAWLDPGFRAWNISEVIDYIRVPVLAIQGAQDQYGSLAQLGEIETRSYCPVDLAVLEDCRHAPHLEQTEATLAAASDFAARLWRIEAAQVETG